MATHTPTPSEEPAPASEPPAWLDELELRPVGTDARGGRLHRMGLRWIDESTWLDVDAQREIQLAHRADLLDRRREEILGWSQPVDAESAELLALVQRSLADHHSLAVPADTADRHPLEVAARSVQEDLCLLHRTEAGLLLVATALCFASMWRPADKLGRPLTDVHLPVTGYGDELADPVDRFIDRLEPGRIALRRNWFVHDDAAWFQPAHVVDRTATEFVIRSERQTLRRLPQTGAVVFTIRVQQARLDSLCDRPDIAASMAAFFRLSPPVVHEMRGIAANATTVLAQLDRFADGEPVLS